MSIMLGLSTLRRSSVELNSALQMYQHLLQLSAPFLLKNLTLMQSWRMLCMWPAKNRWKHASFCIWRMMVTCTSMFSAGNGATTHLQEANAPLVHLHWAWIYSWGPKRCNNQTTWTIKMWKLGTSKCSCFSAFQSVPHLCLVILQSLSG